MILGLQQLGAVTTAMGSLFHAHYPMVVKLFLISSLWHKISPGLNLNAGSGFG